MRFIRNNGLTLALLTFFLISVSGQLLAGIHAYNDERRHAQQQEMTSLVEYAGSAHFRSSLFENWESEFLQMALFVFLTMFLYQKGSSESNPPPDEKQKPDKYPRKRYFKNQPVLRKMYEHSLCTALFVLFVITFIMHAQGSQDMINEENLHMGKPLVSVWGTLKENEFWFESFQNWQSEFFSIAVLGVLSIFLRQKDSPQSKDVDAPHQKTGP